MKSRLAGLVALLLPLTGCFIVSHEDDCKNARVALPSISLRNPYSGECESLDVDACGNPDDGSPSGDSPGPSNDHEWALCSTECDDLDEETCLASDGCRAIYADSNTAGRTFQACWGIAMDGPISGLGCEVEDAHECSRRVDCAAVYDVTGGFQECVAEPEPGTGECQTPGARCTPAR